MTSDDLGPAQKYAIDAGKHIAAVRRMEPEITIEGCWCPSHCEFEGNEKADEWAKPAADELDSHRWSGSGTQDLQWTRRPEAKCWWCQYKIQTREHHFKNCSQWKSQQKTLWATVLEVTKKHPDPVRGGDAPR